MQIKHTWHIIILSSYTKDRDFIIFKSNKCLIWYKTNIHLNTHKCIRDNGNAMSRKQNCVKIIPTQPNNGPHMSLTSVWLLRKYRKNNNNKIKINHWIQKFPLFSLSFLGKQTEVRSKTICFLREKMLTHDSSQSRSLVAHSLSPT